MKLVILYMYLIFTALLVISCSKENKINDEIIFEENSKKFEDIFELVETYYISSTLNKEVKILGINKLFETSNGDFIIYDNANKFLLLIDKAGKIIKTIGQEGKGPGEFSLLSDFIYTKDEKLFALDFLLKKVIYFNNFEFIKDYRLSYVHRNPTQILQCPNKEFIIAAERNLIDGSSNDNFQFLSYKDENFLNIYDENFNFKESFFRPNDKLVETDGILTRPRLTSFTPSCLIEDKIISTSQEGFYNLILFNIDGKMNKKYSVTQRNFTYIDLALVSEYKLNDKNIDPNLEIVGKIMASYSVPISIHKLNNLLIVTILEPYDNYFPMFSTGELNTYNYYIDIFKYEKDNIIPVTGGIQLDRKIIGVTNTGEIYCVKNNHFENMEEIIIEKFRLTL